MLVALINVQLREHVRRQLVLRQHAPHGIFNDLLRLASQTLAVIFGAQTTRVTSVVVILLLLRLHPSRSNLLGVDHDHVIASIEKRRVLRVLFAHQNAGHLRGQPAQGFPGRVHDVPLAHNFPLFGEIG